MYSIILTCQIHHFHSLFIVYMNLLRGEWLSGKHYENYSFSP